jgi:hypothetical protein
MRLGEICNATYEDLNDRNNTLLLRDRKDPRGAGHWAQPQVSSRVEGVGVFGRAQPAEPGVGSIHAVGKARDGVRGELGAVRRGNRSTGSISDLSNSLTIILGLPRTTMRASNSLATRIPDKDVSATRARHSRVQRGVLPVRWHAVEPVYGSNRTAKRNSHGQDLLAPRLGPCAVFGDVPDADTITDAAA